jgi:eukaryotic-like serine/threonine-protein kinase
MAHGVTLIGDRYSVGELLGSGGMAEVRDGVDRRLGRHVAIKTLRSELAAHADIRARFEAEARAAAVLSHPNIVSIYDVGDENGMPYLVMERLPGDSLADSIRRGVLDPEWVRRVGIEVLAALTNAHAASIVHRDVKPANILLTEDDRAKLSDFGIAKAIPSVDRPTATMDLTVTGQLLGTPAYMAPERVHGQLATPSSDIYSIGVVLYEALAGVKPFLGATPLATAAAIERGDHRPLAEARPGLPADLVASVEMAMDRAPERRFTSAGEMSGALAAGSMAPPTVSMPAEPIPTPTEPLAGPLAETVPARTRSNRRATLLVAVVVALLLASGALTWLLVSSLGGSPGHGPTATVPTTAATSSTSAPVTTPPTSASPPTSTLTTAPPPPPVGSKPKPGHHGKD